MKLATLFTWFVMSTACGAVVDPTGPTTPPDPGASLEEPGVDGRFDEPLTPSPPSPLLIEAPRAATTPGSLFAMTFANNAPIIHVLSGEEHARIDVLEQRIVTKTDEQVQLAIELVPPTGTYARTLVSDTVRNGGTYTDPVLCESNNIATYDPRCETATPAVREEPSAGPIMAARWRLWVIDEETGIALSSCIAPTPTQLECVLPGRASVSYRIIASAHGFADLWNDTPYLGPYAMLGVDYVGAPAAQSDWQCWDWRVSGSSTWCAARYEFVRYTAVDRARLDFDPITVRITANDRAVAMTSPALSWDAGNDDLPGPAF